MNRKWMAVVALLVLMLSVCVLAAADARTAQNTKESPPAVFPRRVLGAVIR